MTRSAYDKIAAGLNEALATAPPRLTKAQEAALLWLPADGAWRKAHKMGDARFMAMGYLTNTGLANAEFRDIGEALFGAGRYRLTPAGIAARKELEKRGDVS
jgi:hypothetical protein